LPPDRSGTPTRRREDLVEEKRQDWTLYETVDDGDGRKLWQLRESFPADLDAAQYPVAVVVEWTYSDDGLPDAETLSALHDFERTLGPLDTDAGNSVLVHIIRGNGVSELCFYARDYDRFIDDLNTTLAGRPRYPIAIEFMDDPGWEYRRSIAGNFSQ
jgi:hypothetical protein